MLNAQKARPRPHTKKKQIDIVKNISYITACKYEKTFKKADKMKNTDILRALQHRRKISDFAKFIKVTPRTVYNILNSEKPKDSQYYNFIEYLLYIFTA
jgi:ERCC4-type nuclease